MKLTTTTIALFN